MKPMKSKSFLRIQLVAAAVFIIFEIFASQYMKGFFQSKLNLFFSIAFSCVYGGAVLYAYMHVASHEETVSFPEEESQRNG